jgi:hypothetical protein
MADVQDDPTAHRSGAVGCMAPTRSLATASAKVPSADGAGASLSSAIVHVSTGLGPGKTAATDRDSVR